MRKSRIFGLLMAGIFACLMFSGCGNADGEKTFVGTWEIDSAKFGNDSESLTNKEIDELKDSGYNILVSLKQDGTCQYDFLGEVVEGEWEEMSENTASMMLGGESIELGFAGNKLSFTQNDQVFYFIASNETIGSGIGAGFSAGNTDEMAENAEPSNAIEQSMAGAAWVMCDSEFCTFLVYSEELDAAGNPGYSIRIVNNHSGDIQVSSEAGSFTVNGTPATIELEELVPTGKYVDCGMYFNADEIGGGLELLLEVSGAIAIVDAQTLEVLDRVDFLM